MELVTLRTYQSSMKAHMDRIKLEGEGIPCAVFDEHSLHNVPLYDLATGGIKLKVRDEDVVKALGILSKSRQTPDTGNGNDLLHCPNCNSTNIKTDFKVLTRFKHMILAITSFFFMTRFIPKNKKYQCKQCGKEFEMEDS